MTGTILLVLGNSRTFCKIMGEDGVKYFAHRNEFPDPAIMQEGQAVEFRLKLAKGRPGKDHPVTDVVAIYARRPQPEALSTR